MTTDVAVKLEGWTEFRRALKGAEPKVRKAIGVANKRVADVVAVAARDLAKAQGGVAAKTAESVRALASQKSAQVALGGAAYPFAMGAEFGSLAYKQFKPWRGSDEDAGYFLYPSIRAKRDEVAEMILDAVADELEKSVF